MKPTGIIVDGEIYNDGTPLVSSQPIVLSHDDPVDSHLLDIEKKNDVAEALNSLDEDFEDERGLSKIDMNANLNDDRFTRVTVIDICINLEVLPVEMKTSTQQFKRNTRSIDGFGSKQKENVAMAFRGAEQPSQVAFVDGMKNVLGINDGKTKR